eukprot:m.83868 g.83868  ORF g.83868 m.83868 type:complete len:111 (+) comp12730_c0_seq2:1761-2093(+)
MHIPLPDASARRQIVLNLLHTDAPGKGSSAVLSEADLDKITELTEGYSGSDMSYLCKEAALCPMRDIQDITRISSAEVTKTRVLQAPLLTLHSVAQSLTVYCLCRYVQLR